MKFRPWKKFLYCLTCILWYLDATCSWLRIFSSIIYKKNNKKVLQTFPSLSKKKLLHNVSIISITKLTGLFWRMHFSTKICRRNNDFIYSHCVYMRKEWDMESLIRTIFWNIPRYAVLSLESICVFFQLEPCLLWLS